MPRTFEDVENYLLQLDRRYENDGGTLVLTGSGAPVALRVAPPVVAVRAHIGAAPKDDAHRLALYTQLLRYNATDLMHASYGLDGDRIVLTAALELDNLDINELEAALSDIDLALAKHVPRLHDVAGA